MKHQTAEPPSITLDRPDAPAELIAICARMMAKSPDARFQTASEVSQALGAWLASTRAAAYPELNIRTQASSAIDTATKTARSRVTGPPNQSLVEGDTESGIPDAGESSSGGSQIRRKKLPVARPLDALGEFSIKLNQAPPSLAGERRSPRRPGKSSIEGRLSIPGWLAIALTTFSIIVGVCLLSLLVAHL